MVDLFSCSSAKFPRVRGEFVTYSLPPFSTHPGYIVFCSVNPGDDALKAESAAKDVESSFRSLASKIDTHSEFEDTQLFRFFKENVPEVQDEIKWDMGRTMRAFDDEGRIDEAGRLFEPFESRL